MSWARPQNNCHLGTRPVETKQTCWEFWNSWQLNWNLNQKMVRIETLFHNCRDQILDCVPTFSKCWDQPSVSNLESIPPCLTYENTLSPRRPMPWFKRNTFIVFVPEPSFNFVVDLDRGFCQFQNKYWLSKPRSRWLYFMLEL
jgi:hypothetical protein